MAPEAEATPPRRRQGGAWLDHVDQECSQISAEGRWRTIRTFDAAGPRGVLDGERQVVSFASNDYLGLTQHPAVKAAAQGAIDRWGSGSGASRLVVGSRPVHRDLEAALADWKQTEAALLFPTGFSANLGVLTTFGGESCRIFSDELNHASVIDGARLARADVEVFGHRDLDHLERLLCTSDKRRAMVVTDLVFSMDGDVAPVAGLVETCRRHDALLILDEAHAALGPDLDSGELENVTVLRVGTLSKALGSLGGFVAGPKPFVDLLTNRARSFIFTTAATPADTAAAQCSLQIFQSPEGDSLRQRLADHVQRLAPGWRSPIIPIVVGDERAAVAASEALLAEGLLVPAIRPPTVPAGTSRLRVALSAEHQDKDIDRLATALASAGLPGVRPS